MKRFCLYFVILSSIVIFINCTDSNDKSTTTPSTSLTKRFGEENIFVSLVKSLVEFTSSGFKTGLEASMRSMFNKPVTTAVYALSMLVGVVAMLAFYESPISPMPVPPLPDPPVGRFPPEHPVWPPPNMNQQVPYNHKRAGLGPQITYPSAAASQAFYQYMNKQNDNMKNAQLGMRDKPMPFNHLNESSYNNYISKLTTTNTANVQPSLKQVYNSNSDLSNKVIDYNNKRITVESIKYNNSNNQTSLT